MCEIREGGGGEEGREEKEGKGEEGPKFGNRCRDRPFVLLKVVYDILRVKKIKIVAKRFCLK